MRVFLLDLFRSSQQGSPKPRLAGFVFVRKISDKLRSRGSNKMYLCVPYTQVQNPSSFAVLASCTPSLRSHEKPAYQLS